MINKEQLIFDPADLAASDDVGAYLRSSDGTVLTSTTVGAKKALDVNVANPIALDTATLAALENISAVVTATDLDIRNLDYTLDNVGIKGATGNQLVVNGDGSLNVTGSVTATNNTEKAEDAAHSSGDIGAYVLSVRQDTLAASTSASGDYQSLKTDALGRIYTNDSHQTAVFSAITVSDASATDLVVTDLANRKKILIQNISGRTIFVGVAGVTISSGIRLTGGSSAELEVGAGINLHAISQGGTADVRILELA